MEKIIFNVIDSQHCYAAFCPKEYGKYYYYKGECFHINSNKTIRYHVFFKTLEHPCKPVLWILRIGFIAKNSSEKKNSYFCDQMQYIHSLFSFIMGHLCPPGSDSGFSRPILMRIRIHALTGLNPYNELEIPQKFQVSLVPIYIFV